MNIDFKLSGRLKKKYKHKLGECYCNAWDLYQKEKCDKLVIGYVISNGNFVFRHGWVVKNDEIIDSTLDFNKEATYEYYPVFIFDESNLGEAMRKTSGKHFYEYDVEKECNFIMGNFPDKYTILCADEYRTYNHALMTGMIQNMKIKMAINNSIYALANYN